MKRTLRSGEVLRILESYGWEGTQNSTSHIVCRHPENPAVLSFPFRSGRQEIQTGLLGKIQRLSGINLRSTDVGK